MNRTIFGLLAIVFCCQLVASQFYGVANLAPTGQGASNNVSGTVSFYQAAVGTPVNVTVNLSGNFEPRLYAVHVHTFGDLSYNFNGTSVGGHYVGEGSQTHGCPEFQNDTRHEGDMGNFQATTTTITGSKYLNFLALSGNFSIIGRAVVLHMNQDNCTVPPTGGAGNYIAFGAIGVQNMTTNPAVNNDSSITSAVAVLSPTYLAANYCNNCYGSVLMTQTSTGISFTASIYGLSNSNPHGIHVHTYGDLSTPNNGLSVGGHWNPTGASHALPGTSPRHLGDIGNVQSFENGVGYYQATFPTAEVGTLGSILGRGIVIHALSDKGNGAGCDQAGGSGSRILWGVIGAQNTAVAPTATVPSSVVVNNNYTAMPCTVPTPSPAVSFSPSPPSTGSAALMRSWFSLLF
eukprot:TRINITY_DN1249_c0_g1_i1.p1 TRINITY_DN1249_c0_g1~~TRINITY_DN1249_c0_g1_i1.p1  ORF type:complete len:404 (+),score=110.09 TRINITY_DN1249_c0_g1_i1:92-1303(+)